MRQKVHHLVLIVPPVVAVGLLVASVVLVLVR